MRSIAFTPRLIFLLSLAIPFHVFGLFVPDLVTYAVAGSGVVLALLVIDFCTIPAAGRLEIGRRVPEILSQGSSTRVSILVRNRADRPLRLRLADHPPLPFLVSERMIEALSPAQSVGVFHYSVRCYERGEYEFGPIDVRVHGVLGLAVRQRRYAISSGVKVYPDISKMQRRGLLVGKGVLQQVGVKRSRILGEGREFVSLRQYYPGDDVRIIDWKATARQGRPISREYETERNQRMIILLDTGRLMTTKIDELAKLDYAVNAALLLAEVAIARGDQVGLLIFSNVILCYIEPCKGRKQLMRISHVLYGAQPEFCEADYAGAYAFLMGRNKRRSLVVTFTDLLDIESSKILLSRNLRLMPRHLPLCVTISDSDVLGLVQGYAEDSQTLMEQAIAYQVLQEYRKVVLALENRGALTVNVPAADLTTATINRYLEAKYKGLL